MSASRVLLQLTVVIYHTYILVEGNAQITVTPFPALIFHGAVQNVPVLSVTATDTDTGQPLQSVALTNSRDSDYFKLIQQPRVPNEWILKVKKTIDKPVGYVFTFSVYGYYNQTPQDRRIQINVTEENEHAPSFEQQEYTFVALRNGLDYNLTDIGTVKAVDADTEIYNKQFHYHILDPHAERYFLVDLETGLIEMTGNIPAGVSNVTFSVTAIDGGSPQRLNTTDVTVIITDLRPPDVFCVAVEESIARVCWKDPTNGSYVMKYELLFKMDDQNATTVPVRVEGVKDETCSIVTGNQLGRNYTFSVRVFNGLEWSPESLQRKVTIEKKGLYGSCPDFSNCSVWEPCQNKGECLVNQDMSYTCNCSKGWGGVNCTDVDLCASAPCRNGGTCVFTGDRNYTCNCPDTHYGNVCEYFNICSTIPCKNDALCMNGNNTFTCICRDHFVGELCETPDPCVPSPCMHGNCSSANNKNFSCSCQNGYFGDLCENEDICALYQPCNQGSCTANNVSSEIADDKYTCSCNVGYRGKRCDNLDMCELTSMNGMELCRNNGTCHYKEISSYNCVCADGFWGAECQYYDPCYDKPCGTGNCKNVSDEEYICECHGGNFGRNCEHFNPCYDKPCHSNIQCLNISDTDYRCICPVERFGKNCEKINGCNINFCHHNSSCLNVTEAGGVECVCQSGYSGKFCDIYDPCLLQPCMNNASCSSSSGEFTCACVSGYRGDKCQYTDPCAENPCWNEGTCVQSATNVTKYRCLCENIFYGTHCENLDFCKLGHDCENGGTCIIQEGREAYEIELRGNLTSSNQVNVTNRPTCVCLHGYSGDRCDKISPCVQSPCGKGHCVQKGEGHVCNCPDGIVRISCEEVFCEIDDSFYDKTGWYTWPRTKAGDTTQVLCRHGPNSIFSTGYASRYCNVDVNGTTFWDIPNTSQCLELQTEDVSQNLRNLATLTKDASGLRSEEIANITSTLEEYFFFSFENIEIAKEMTMVVGNLLDANETVMIESNFKNHSSERLLWLLEEYSKRVNTTGEIVIETENINLQVVNHTVPDTSYSYTPQLEQNNIKRKGGINLKLPAEALTSSDAEEFPRIRLMTFRSSSFFIPEEAPPQEVVMKQWVVSAVVQDRKLENLTTPVEITVKNIEDGVNHSCAYWDIKNRTWSDEGVVTLERGQNYTKCLSYHLTSFAILLDPSPDHALSAEHEQILTYISYIGCGISMLGLILTLITYSIFRCLNREKSGKILMNLCASMLLLNAFFFLGSETSLSLSGDGMCKAAAILLHYFLLTTLTWMLVEAINMYQALITVFTKYSGFFMLKRCIFAWGAPALIVIATVAISVDNYKTTTELCFLSQGNPLAFYIALLGPACLILLINFAVFIMVSRVILKPKFHGQVGRNASDSVTPAQIRGAFTVMTLLGVTWVFGPFAINEAKVVVNYIFTVLNSLQGFLIFVFRCCFNPEVRMAWVMLIKTGKFKRRKGPATAYTSDSTSSKSESKLNGSVNDTMKSNVYNSLGKQRNVLNNDKNLVSKNTNMQAKTSKDLHGYFDDTQRHRGREKRSGSSENTRLYGRNYDNYDRNGFHSNGNHQRRSSDQNAITTIYTGQYNGGVKRHSGLISHQDEFTRL
ncbi:uncharacterized protein LOC123528907 isoform X2 [Mercenaria mercenaria]|uniref:uncharacterized protein LOC123528907 isoform X2 n=1 Tax=Mercenaria mercenaria TaxID=6596 RepID=UPI00234ED4D1|nr:uncharacterized protein LOC123528907 isoform X2 [Mercenaria mercenaria]